MALSRHQPPNIKKYKMKLEALQIIKQLPVAAQTIRLALAGVAASLLTGIFSLAPAQAVFPSRPIEVIVPWGPGGGSDITGRMVAKFLEAELKVAAPVVNLPGASGTIGVQRLISDLNRIYKEEPSLHQLDFDWSGFEWLELHDWENSVLAFLRRGKTPGDEIVVVCNFTPIVRQGYRIGVNRAGFYRELLNTDSECYDGTNVGNSGGVWSKAGPHGTHAHHLELTLPPLGVVFLKPENMQAD